MMKLFLAIVAIVSVGFTHPSEGSWRLLFGNESQHVLTNRSLNFFGKCYFSSSIPLLKEDSNPKDSKPKFESLLKDKEGKPYSHYNLPNLGPEYEDQFREEISWKIDEIISTAESHEEAIFDLTDVLWGVHSALVKEYRRGNLVHKTILRFEGIMRDDRRRRCILESKVRILEETKELEVKQARIQGYHRGLSDNITKYIRDMTFADDPYDDKGEK